MRSSGMKLGRGQRVLTQLFLAGLVNLTWSGALFFYCLLIVHNSPVNVEGAYLIINLWERLQMQQSLELLGEFCHWMAESGGKQPCGRPQVLLSFTSSESGHAGVFSSVRQPAEVKSWLRTRLSDCWAFYQAALTCLSFHPVWLNWFRFHLTGCRCVLFLCILNLKNKRFKTDFSASMVEMETGILVA